MPLLAAGEKEHQNTGYKNEAGVRQGQQVRRENKGNSYFNEI